MNKYQYKVQCRQGRCQRYPFRRGTEAAHQPDKYAEEGTRRGTEARSTSSHPHGCTSSCACSSCSSRRFRFPCQGTTAWYGHGVESERR